MSAFWLRLIACVAMLLDHIGYLHNNMALRAVGRIAFPIFTYLLCNGFRHTSSRWRYALRLAIFALLSQIPFSLLCANTLRYQTGNVFFTLLAALLCIWATDLLRKDRVGKWLCWLPTIFLCLVYQLGWLYSDYGARGIVLAMIFYVFDGKKWWQRLVVSACCLAAVFYSHLVSAALTLILYGKLSIPTPNKWDLWQLFSLAALPLIFLYNGKKGPTPQNKFLAKAVQLGFYLFYPVHMLLLWLLNLP